MPLQFNPIFFGVMLVVAVGTVAYTYLSRPQVQTHRKRTSENTVHLRSRCDTKPQAQDSSNKSTTGERRRNTNKEGDVCSICLEEVDKVVLTLECSHSFHYKCLTQWCGKPETKTCPNCRKEAAI